MFLRFLFIRQQKRNKKTGKHATQVAVEINFSNPCGRKGKNDQNRQSYCGYYY